MQPGQYSFPLRVSGQLTRPDAATHDWREIPQEGQYWRRPLSPLHFSQGALQGGRSDQKVTDGRANRPLLGPLASEGGEGPARLGEIFTCCSCLRGRW